MDQLRIVIHRTSGDTLVTYNRDEAGNCQLVSEIKISDGTVVGNNEYLPDGRMVRPPQALNVESLPIAPTDEKSLVEQYIGIVVEKLRLGGDHAKVSSWPLPNLKGNK